eukprot:jgi/Pico_ML_1/50979/g179.t1
MEHFERKMKEAGLNQAAIGAFRQNYHALAQGDTGLLAEGDIAPVTQLPNLQDLKKTDDPKQVAEMLQKTAVLKLNGGLGTSMGLDQAKSLLEVKDGHSFLDLIAMQIKDMRKRFGAEVKFVLMNSFSTSEDTNRFMEEKHGDLAKGGYLELLQNKSPKVDLKTMLPASYPENPDLEWCPPGHGDIYPSLLGTGMLDKLIQDGIEYVFVSNSDNLGATLDVDLLAHFASKDTPFMMEVCERTESDKKGGHLCVTRKSGKLTLRESAMCPAEDMDSFQDIRKHRFFNTNNLWLNLTKLKDVLEKNDGVLPLPLIKNKKTINPREDTTAEVYQLETAMGSAIEAFDGAGAVCVPRSRFAPVKTCNDLFALRSDAYVVTDDSRVVLAEGVANPPVVKLDDQFYKKVDKFDRLVKGKEDVRIRPGTSADRRWVWERVFHEKMNPCTPLFMDGFLLAVEAKDERVGCLKVVRGKGYVELSSLIVVPERRQQGVAKKLVRAAQAQLSSDHAVYLTTIPSASGFWNRLGFHSVPWQDAPLPLVVEAGLGNVVSRLAVGQPCLLLAYRKEGPGDG